MHMPTEATRAYIYRVIVAVGLLLLGTGVVSEETWPLILGLIATLLGNGQAALNTSTKSTAK